MQTNHKLIFESSANLNDAESNSVDLIVTSPPYPMIAMWDEIFIAQNDDIKSSLDDGDGFTSFEKMNQVLDKVWDGCIKVLKPGGIICINIGDATRKIAKTFQIFPNHARIIQYFLSKKMYELPSILWRKPNNSPNKFMGSGMLPTNAYVTLEHEYILIFRKGANRKFKPKSKSRYESAFFWEERNQWFSDIWTDLKGASQLTYDSNDEIRTRSAEYPISLPMRLINMYSIYGDVVLDPFLGTGTTTLAAMLTGRNSLGYERNFAFRDVISKKLMSVKAASQSIVEQRIEEHLKFVKEREGIGKTVNNISEYYNFKIVTKQETKIRFKLIKNVEELEDNEFSVKYDYF